MSRSGAKLHTRPSPAIPVNLLGALEFLNLLGVLFLCYVGEEAALRNSSRCG